MRIYLDVCCLARPFDDQSHERIRLETEAVKLVLGLCIQGVHHWISSDVVIDEILRDQNEKRRSALLSLVQWADQKLKLDDRTLDLARSFTSQSMGAMDALHLALAETSECDILLTTDDAFMTRDRSVRPGLKTRVDNPARWIVETLEP